MKKRFFSILLSLCMVLMLFPATAFAEGNTGITISGPDVVCAQQQYEFTVTAADGITLTGEFGFDTGSKGDGSTLTLDENGVGHGVMPTEWYDLQSHTFELSAYGRTANQELVVGTKTVQVSSDHIFVNGVCGCGAIDGYTVQYDGGGAFPLLADVKIRGVDLTLAGKTFYRDGYVQTGWIDANNTEYALGGIYSTDADITLYPVWDELITLSVPFTTTVKLGGEAVPGETTFKLAIVGANADDSQYADVTVSASVTTNSEGSYEGTMTLSGPSRQLNDMLCEGAFVQQVNEGKDGWTYDDTVWGLLLWQGIAEYSTDDAATEDTVLILPVICEEADDGMYYDLDWEANPVDRMTFTNTYTKSAQPAENNPNTGDSSNLTLWFALLAVSAAGVISTGVHSKRRRSS